MAKQRRPYEAGDASDVPDMTPDDIAAFEREWAALTQEEDGPDDLPEGDPFPDGPDGTCAIVVPPTR